MTDPARRYDLTYRDVRQIVVTELAALVNEAFPHEDVDYATACERLVDLVQCRELDLIRGAVLRLPTELIEERPWLTTTTDRPRSSWSRSPVVGTTDQHDVRRHDG